MGSSEDALARTRASAVSVVSQQQWQSWASMTDLQSAAVRVLENTLRTTGVHACTTDQWMGGVSLAVFVLEGSNKKTDASFQTRYYQDMSRVIKIPVHFSIEIPCH